MHGDLVCPSSPAGPASVVIGVVRAPGEVDLLRRAVPFVDVAHLIPDAVPADEVVRLASPCAERACGHFQNARCSLATRIVDTLAPVAAAPPPCAIRAVCRWWHEERVAACLRCPQVVTASYSTDRVSVALATPASALPVH